MEEKYDIVFLEAQDELNEAYGSQFHLSGIIKSKRQILNKKIKQEKKKKE